jgi:hypothetical protein
MITNQVLDSPAWRAMSHGARSLYLALRRRYSHNFHNNGKIYLSTRIAAAELGSGCDRVAEVFLSSHKLGSQADANARDAAVAASLAFQYGCPLDVLRGALLRDSRGRPATPLGVALDIAAAQGTGSAP